MPMKRNGKSTNQDTIFLMIHYFYSRHYCEGKHVVTRDEKPVVEGV